MIVNMEDALEYELLDIEWDLNYEFDLESLGKIVRDATDDTGDEPTPLVYDENGIPMGESPEAIKQRKQIIYDFYQEWKADHPEKSVYNKSLNADILIRKESVVEAAGHAAKRYKSTLAVFKLEEILSCAVQVALDIPKRDNKNQSKLIKMILMSYNDTFLGTIKLTVGVRNRTLDKIQYGITALKENETIEPLCLQEKNKASHKK